MSLRSETQPVHEGWQLVEHELDVPLDHAGGGGGTIRVFAREVTAEGGEHLPWLVFLQGGPGGESPRPVRRPLSPAWLERALVDFRVLLLDQRGTGRSTPVGTLPGLTPAEQASYLSHFRADSIVADAELLREALGIDRWSLLGQSFGGFCALHYLSSRPGSLRSVMFTGGLPPVGNRLPEVYAATYARVRERNERHHRRWPGDRGRLTAMLDASREGRVVLPDGEAVTPRRLRSVGSVLGMSDGSEHLHHLLERDVDSPELRHALASAFTFSGRSPLYAVLQEACYADGGSTRWAAEKEMPDDFRTDETLLLGEHVFPSTFADDRSLRPLAEAADLLAAHDWPRLYDADTLRDAEVPCAAAVFADDPYVERVLSEQTAALLPRMSVWLTAEHDHNALRAAGDTVLDTLIGRLATL